MTTIIYCRVSSKEQVEGTSLAFQEAACREYATNHGLQVLEVFIEEGESAKYADRTQLLRLIAFCQDHKGRVETLLVWKLDRFARNVADHFSVKATLIKCGVRVVSVTEPVDSKPEGQLMETILAGFAQFDNDVRSARTVHGMVRKLHDGIWPWKPPFGYLPGALPGEKKNRPDQPDLPLFDILQRGFKEFATGRYTKAEMKRLLTTWGARSKAGEDLTDQFIDKMFQNPYYAGILIDPWSGEEVPGQHTPMVSREDFDRIQVIVSKRNRSLAHRKERDEFPLRGFARCSECGRYLTGSFSRGRSSRYAYYHCCNRECAVRGRTVPAETVDAEFAQYLATLSLTEGEVEGIRQFLLGYEDDGGDARKAQESRRIAELNAVEREMQELVSMRSRELITDDEFKPSRAELIARRRELAPPPAAIRTATPRTIASHFNSFLDPLADFADTWLHARLPLRSRFQRMILPVGYIVGHVGTAETSLCVAFFQAFLEGNTTGVTQSLLRSNQLDLELEEFFRVLREMDESSGTVQPSSGGPLAMCSNQRKESGLKKWKRRRAA